MKKCVLFPLDIIASKSEIETIIRQYQSEDLKIVALTYDAANLLEEMSYPFIFKEEAECEGLLFRVNPFVTEIAREWFNASGIYDGLNYQNINLGSLCSWDFIYTLNVLVDRWLNLRELVDRYKPDSLVIASFKSKPEQVLFQKNESALPEILPMIEREFKLLEIKRVLLDINKKRTLIKTRAFSLFVSFVLKIRNWILDCFKQSAKEHIVFYSGWWHFMSVIKTLRHVAGIKVTLIQRQFGFHLLKVLFFTRVRLENPTHHTIRLDLNWERYKRQIEAYFEQKKFEDINLYPLLEERFRYFFNHHASKLASWLINTEKLLRRIQGSTLLAENDTVMSEKTMICVANRLGMRTIVLQHGMTSGGKAGLQPNFANHAYLPLTADQLVVHGKMSYDYFLSAGVNHDRLFMAGCPRFDDYFTNKFHTDRIAFFRKHRLPLDKKIVIYANTPYTKNMYSTKYHLRFGEIETLVHALVQSIDQIQDAHLVIKMKSLDQKDQLDCLDRHIKLYQRPNVTVLYDVSVKELLYHCDLLISSWSTMGVEALFLNRPILTINLTNRPDPVPYAEFKGSVGVYRKEDLRSAIDQLLINPSTGLNERQKFIEQYLISIRGDATKRLMYFILNPKISYASESHYSFALVK